MTTFRHDLDPDRAARQRVLWLTTLAAAGLSGLLAAYVGLDTVRAVAREEKFAELGYFVALGIAFTALLAAGLAGIGRRLQGQVAGWWVLGAALAVALSPFLLWLWAGIG